VVEALLGERLEALLVAARHVLALELAAHHAANHLSEVLEPAIEEGLQTAQVPGGGTRQGLLQLRQLGREARQAERLGDGVREAALLEAVLDVAERAALGSLAEEPLEGTGVGGEKRTRKRRELDPG